MKDQFNIIRRLLPKEHKKALLILTFLLFVGMFLEVIGLGLILPILTILLNPTQVFEYLDQIEIYDFNLLTYNEIVVFSLIVLISVYLFKAFFLVFINFKQNIILENIAAFFSVKLYKKYIFQSYKDHLNREISDIIKNLQTEVIYFQSYCRNLISLLIEISFSFSILLTITYLEPLGALIVGGLFSILALFYYQLTRKKVKFWGETRQEIDGRLYLKVLESFSGIKELKLLNKENIFIEDYIKNISKKAKISSNQVTLSQLPRIYFEIITVITMVILISSLLYLGNESNEIITILGVFVVAAFRIIPSFNKILSSTQNLKFYEPSINKISSELFKEDKSIKLKNQQNLSFKDQIIFNNVFFSYKSEDVLKDFNLKITKGETIGIIGESGSGKSTIVNLLTGLLEPVDGQVLIDNIDLKKIKNQWLNNLGYVGQEVFLLDTSIKNNIAFEYDDKRINQNRIEHVIKLAQLEKFTNNLPNGIETRVGERGIQLSGGQRQRIAIARALYNSPEVIILDEATASLDNLTEKEVMNAIYGLKGNKTLIIVAHRLSTLVDCDHVYEVKNGKVKIKEKQWINSI